MSHFEVEPGVRLYVDDRGRGQPIVFVHAWSMAHWFWENQVAALMGKHRVVSYDHRGHGQSDKPDGVYDIDGYARDLHRLITGLGLEDVTLVGWSIGMWIVTTYMNNHKGERVKRLGLVGGSPLLLKQPGWEHGMAPEVMGALAEQLASDRAKATEDFYRMMLNKQASQQMIDWIVRTSLMTPLAVAMPSFQSVVTKDLRPYLTNISVPTAVFHGMQDGVPLGAAHAVRDMVPNARLFTFEKSGHFPMIEEPQAFTQALATWIAET
jgi:non-heme chloroperoxidase